MSQLVRKALMGALLTFAVTVAGTGAARAQGMTPEQSRQVEDMVKRIIK